MRYIVGLMAIAALLASGCGSDSRVVTVTTTVPSRQANGNVPDLVGENLHDAQEELDSLGIGYDAETGEGGEPLLEHLWEVCSQDPPAGSEASFVRLGVEHSCDGD